jgi:6-phosphogluconolactonase
MICRSSLLVLLTAVFVACNNDRVPAPVASVATGTGGSASPRGTGGGAGTGGASAPAGSGGGSAATGGASATDAAATDAAPSNPSDAPPADSAAPDTAPPSGNPYVYVGATSDPRLRVFQLDLLTGALTLKGMAMANEAPNYLAVHPSRRFIYVTSQVTAGRVVAFAIDAAGQLTRLNDMATGGDPAHISLHKSGRWLLVANYFAGNAAVLPVGDDGRLGAAVSTVPAGAEAHMAVDDGVTGNFVFVPSKGSNRLNQFKFDPATGKLSPNTPASLSEGGAPRHIAFQRAGKFAYLLTEGSRTVVSYNYDPSTGLLSPLGRVVAGNSGFASTIVMHPSKELFYAGVRGPDTITAYAIEGDGRPRSVGVAHDELSYPWDFALDATGSYLVAANNTSASIKVFRVDPQTGVLTLVGGVAVPAAVRTVRVVYPPG